MKSQISSRKYQDKNQRTTSLNYTNYLTNYNRRWWKKLIDPQALFKWNIKRLDLGFVLDIGCGVGRNLIHLSGYGVGIDTNFHSIELVRSFDLTAFTPEEFFNSNYAVPERFDSLLLSHILEHMTFTESLKILEMYLPYIKTGGKIIIITPQEIGYQADTTHIEFIDFSKAANMCNHFQLQVYRQFSFPFSRIVGKFFRYNEFTTIAKKL